MQSRPHVLRCIRLTYRELHAVQGEDKRDNLHHMQLGALYSCPPEWFVLILLFLIAPGCSYLGMTKPMSKSALKLVFLQGVKTFSDNMRCIPFICATLSKTYNSCYLCRAIKDEKFNAVLVVRKVTHNQMICIESPQSGITERRLLTFLPTFIYNTIAPLLLIWRPRQMRGS